MFLFKNFQFPAEIAQKFTYSSRATNSRQKSSPTFLPNDLGSRFMWPIEVFPQWKSREKACAKSQQKTKVMMNVYDASFTRSRHIYRRLSINEEGWGQRRPFDYTHFVIASATCNELRSSRETEKRRAKMSDGRCERSSRNCSRTPGTCRGMGSAYTQRRIVWESLQFTNLLRRSLF